jgi:hypothetical protein
MLWNHLSIPTLRISVHVVVYIVTTFTLTAFVPAFSILHFTEKSKPSGLYLKKKPPPMVCTCQQVNQRCLSGSNPVNIAVTPTASMPDGTDSLSLTAEMIQNNNSHSVPWILLPMPAVQTE